MIVIPLLYSVSMTVADVILGLEVVGILYETSRSVLKDFFEEELVSFSFADKCSFWKEPCLDGLYFNLKSE